ncbi:MAG: DNRLRE domain-containing protein [Planctomycetes bacterium]|nr:DNRLRE domain-containing protein [Planctomycetota bacterium]
MRRVGILLGVLVLGGSAFGASWLNQDVGTPSPAGSATDVNGDGTIWDLSAGGADIWGTADAFHYVFLQDMVSGDFAASCLVETLTLTNTWTKVGIMARNDLDADSINAFIAITPQGGQQRISHQWREAKAGGSGSSHNTTFFPPMYLRLERRGRNTISYYSNDGIGYTLWRERGLPTLADDVYLGLALTSHADGTAATTTISEVDMQAPPFQNPADLACTITGPSTVSLTWDLNGGTYSSFVLSRVTCSGKTVVSSTIPGTATSYEDTGAALTGPVRYLLHGIPDDGSPYLVEALHCVVIPDTEPIIPTDGFIRDWLIVGPLQESGGAPGIANVRRDYIIDTTGKGEAEFLPEAGDTVAIDYAATTVTSVLTRPDTVNPRHAEGIADVVAWRDCDDTINFDDVFNFNAFDNFVAYSIVYLTNVNAEPIVAQCATNRDDSIQVKLDNDEVFLANQGGGVGGAGTIRERIPVVIPPGEHRLMVKLFEGGGGNGFRLRFEDLANNPIGFAEGLDLSLTPTITELPAALPAVVIRRPQGVMLGGEAAPVTLSVSGIGDEKAEIIQDVPAGWTIDDAAGGTVAGQTITWTDVGNGDLVYRITPPAAQAAGFVYLPDGICVIGDRSNMIRADDALYNGLTGHSFTSIGTRLTDDVVEADFGNPGDPAVVGTSALDLGPPVTGTITAGGSDIWGTVDHGHFVFGEFDGSFVIEASLEAFPRVNNDWQKAGVMVRTTGDGSSPYAFVLIRSGPAAGPSGYGYQGRTAFGASAVYAPGSALTDIAIPNWMRVIAVYLPDQNAYEVNGYITLADDPTDWTAVGTLTLPANADGTILGGLAVTSHDNGTANAATATFGNVAWADLPGCGIADPTATRSGAGVDLAWNNVEAGLASIVVERLGAQANVFETIAELAGDATSYKDTSAPNDVAILYRLTAIAEYGGTEIPICTRYVGSVADGYAAFQDGVFPGPDYVGTQDTHIIRHRSDQYDDDPPHLYNMGAHTHIEEGDYAGGHADHKEILVQFDLSSIPAGATVDAAELWLYYDFQRNTGVTSVLHSSYAHEVLKAWNEGQGTGVDGTEAQAGEATWRWARAGEETWDVDSDIWLGTDYPDDQRGGAYGPTDIDTSEAILSSDEYGDVPGTWVAWDVTPFAKGWVADPSTNHGVKITQNPGNNPSVDYVAGGYDFASSNNPTAYLRPILILKASGGGGRYFIHGDTDGNGQYTIGDGVQILERLFANRTAFTSDCEETGDVDGNGILTIGDAVWLFNYLFAEGELKKRPAPPADTCGTAPILIGCNKDTCTP